MHETITLLCASALNAEENYVVEIINELLYAFTSINKGSKLLFVNTVHLVGDKRDWNEVVEQPDIKLIDEIPGKRDDEKWSDIWSKFKEKNSGHLLLNLTTKDEIKSYNKNIEERILPGDSYIKIDIKIHGCCQSLANFLDGRNNLGHLLVNKCSQNLYLNLVNNPIFYKTLSLIGSDSTSIIPSDPCYFDFKNNILCTADIDYLDYWVAMRFNQPKCYFSYASKDNLNELMDDINFCVNRYFPFINFERDKDDKHDFTNINRYVSNLVDGEIVFFIIGENYLTSYYALLELEKTFTKFDLFGKNINELNSMENTYIENLSKNGRFILFTANALKNKIHTVNANKLKIEWLEQIKINKDEGRYDEDDLNDLYNKIDEIYTILNCINSPNSLCDHYKDRYKKLVPHISRALDNSITGYYNIYKNLEPDELPSILSLNSFKPDRDITDLICLEET